ncbi:heavy metal-responsive transcriptional regulator [Arthrobacter sp. ISL-65]|uniref:heavy metal-responsive transcriptional regulator n=1 Tax=Arthrobacter sp. ISL-65 TaxID=2819112 RepID=UPI001BE929DD|nr:heavy metal-responsive transcriptional regulator [Arthrobacter sp. ISL-65]MBT2547206.1 heavy metal-responsive transcriptional regulator [Arthrobacter sp. ISL-65]
MRIGEAAAAAGMTAKTLRFYEDSGLLPEANRSSNGYRHYNHESVTRLEFIRRGRAAGLTLAQIREILALRDAGEAPCTHVQELLEVQLAALDQQIAELTALRSSVAALRATATAQPPASCDPARICSYL